MNAILGQLQSLLDEDYGEGAPGAPAPAPTAPFDFSTLPGVKPAPKPKMVEDFDFSTLPGVKPAGSPASVSPQAAPAGAGDNSRAETLWQNTKEFLKGMPQGAGIIAGSSLQGAAGLDATARQYLGKWLPEIEKLPTMDEAGVKAFVGRVNKEYKNNPLARRMILEHANTVLKDPTTIEGFRKRANTPTKETGLYKAGEAVREGADIFPAAPGYEESIGRQMGQGLGTLGGGIVASIINPALGATMFTLGGSGEAAERAIVGGASEEDIATASAAGLAPGATDIIPVEIILNKIPLPKKWKREGIGRIKKAIKRIGLQAFIEGVQEGGQQWLQNFISREIYNPDQPLGEGLAPAAGLGASVGAWAETFAHLVGARRSRRSAPPIPQTPPDPGQTAPDGAQPALPPPAIRLPDQAQAGLEQTIAAGLEAELAAGQTGTSPGQVPSVPLPPAPIINPSAVAILKGSGYADEDIAMMPPEQVAEEVAQAIEQGVEADFSSVAQPVAPAQGAGTAKDPVKVTTRADVDRAAQQADTEPTPAQAEAGNYKKGHINWNGMDLAIETPSGADRTGIDSDGEEWRVTMPRGVDYGYIKRTEGADGDHVDAFIVDDLDSDQIFIIDQMDGETFDEHKVVIGTNNADSARAIYESAYSDDIDRVGGITELSVDEFKTWLKDGDQKVRLGREELNPGKLDKQLADFEDAGRVAFENGLPNTPPRGHSADNLLGFMWLKGWNKAQAAAAANDAELGGMVESALDDVFPTDTPETQSVSAPFSVTKPTSWVIRRKSDGEVQLETSDQKKIDALNTDKYEAVPIKEHLASLNEKPAKTPTEQAVKPDKGQIVSKSEPEKTLIKQSDSDIEAAFDRYIDRKKSIHPQYLAPALGITEKQAVELLHASPKAQITRSGKWRRTPKYNPRNPTLIDWLGGEGLVDDPELRVIFDKQVPFIPGHGPLIRKGGRTLDYAREAAAEANYLPMDSTVADLLVLIEEDFRHGGVYAETADSTDMQAEAAGKAAEEANEEAADRVKAELDANGIVYDDALVAEVMALWAESGSLEDAIEPVIIRDELGKADETVEAEIFENDIPFPDAHIRPAETGESVPASEEGEPEESGGVRPEPQADSRPDQDAVEEEEIRADDADETVTISLSLDGPWDFNDTYPAADPELAAALEREGRLDLEIDDPFAVASTFDESMSELQQYIRDIAGGRSQIAAIKAGKAGKPPKRKMSKEKWQADIMREIKYAQKAIRDINGVYTDIFGSGAAMALVREARKREVQLKASSPGPLVPPKAPTTEKTEAGTQSVIPGAEQITKAEEAQRKADEKLKPKTDQKAADSGLFGDSMDQTEFSMEPAKPAKPLKNKELGDLVDVALDDVFEEGGVEQGTVGMMMSEGQQVLTSTGRKTTPFPKIGANTNRKTINAVKRVDRWLMQNAIDEAKSRGDEFNQLQFEGNLEKPQQADKDGAESYLFDPDFNQPVPPSILKPLTAAFDPANHIKVAADNISKLRADDVYRLFVELPANADQFDDLRVYIIENRPDLTTAVVEAIDDVGMPARPVEGPTAEQTEARNADRRAKGETIKKYVASGGTVSIPVNRGSIPYKNADMIEIRNDGPYFQAGKKWNAVTDEQLNHMVAQTGDRTAGAAATSAIKNVGTGLKDVAEGLNALFNDPKKLGAGPSFDDETYRKALPLFKSGVAHFAEAGRDVADMIKALVRYLADNGMDRPAITRMKPYIVRFMQDVQKGKETIDVPDSSGDLESDSGGTTAQDGLGETDVSAPAGSTRGSLGERGSADSQEGGRPQGSSGVSDSDASTVGGRSDLFVPDAPSSVDGPAGPVLVDPGGGIGDIEGHSNDQIPAETVEQPASNSPNLEARKKAQVAAETIPIKPGIDNIRETLPVLHPQQQDDVAKIEDRYAAEGSPAGMLITSGTGTGKTFVGLGVVKRFHRQGKKNILLIAPGQGVLDAWVDAGAVLGLDVNILRSKKDAGHGISATTFANMAGNRTLADRDFDLIVIDETHRLMENKAGKQTQNLQAFRAISNHPNHLNTKARMRLRDLDDQIKAKFEALKQARKYDIQGASRIEEELQKLTDEFDAKAGPLLEEWRTGPRPKALFLSATPFARHFSLDYAEGYLFDYPTVPESMGYNAPSGRDQFYMENLGYRKRFGKLTVPEAGVDLEIMERELHEKLRKSGAIHGRMLEVEHDYDRKFITVHDADGTRIDEILKWLGTERGGRYRKLHEYYNGEFTYLKRMRLLEAIKARAVIPHIKKNLAMGRKVMTFNNYNEGGGFNVFPKLISDETVKVKDKNGKPESVTITALYNEFIAANPDAAKMDFAEYQAPMHTLVEEFGDRAALYNGSTVSKKKRADNLDAFNEKGSGVDILVIQADAGGVGLSAHDTVGDTQRIMYNLGLPNRPVTAIQQEGRIYRDGQASDAMFRYANTGTSWERMAFATTIGEAAGTVENLGMGNLARALKQAFIDAYEESDAYPPGFEGEGKGGKEADRSYNTDLTEFERAKTHYFAQAKKKGRRDQREGVDYFATPEPVGFKMVELANIKAGDNVLEPSAGHGAISRYIPETASKTIVEPSEDLLSRALLRTPGARTVQDRFENLDIVNKYDAIVMNPPYGSGGKTAMDHLAKAAIHLRNGGRIVALLPDGPAANKKFDKFFDETEDLFFVAEVIMPAVTFERAGTKVRTRIVVLDKQTDAANQIRMPQSARRDYTDAETINDLFDRIENLEIADRAEPITKDLVEPEVSERPKPVTKVSDAKFTLKDAFHAKRNQKLYVAAFDGRVPRDIYIGVRQIAEEHGGYYSPFKKKPAVPGFQFESTDDRQKFLDAVAASGSPAPEEKFAAAPRRRRKPWAYSGLLRAAETGKMDKGQPAQWLAFLQKQPGVKKDELDWIGLPAWLSDQTGAITREDVTGFIAANQIDVTETVLGGAETQSDRFSELTGDYDTWRAQSPYPAMSADELQMQLVGVLDGRNVLDSDEAEQEYTRDVSTEQLEEDVEWLETFNQEWALTENRGVSGTTRYDNRWVLPGGKSNRELLLTLPDIAKEPRPEPVKTYETLPDDYTSIIDRSHPQGLVWAVIRTDQSSAKPLFGQHRTEKAAIDEARTLLADQESGRAYDSWKKRNQPFQSGHYPQPNLLAHVRFNERASSDPGFVVVHRRSGNKSPVFETNEAAEEYQSRLPKPERTRIEGAPQGKRTLFIEEIQSDWHQQGRERGYAASPEQRTALHAELAEAQKAALDEAKKKDNYSWGSPKAFLQALRMSQAFPNAMDIEEKSQPIFHRYIAAVNALKNAEKGVPDAPFKTTWPELSLKRMIRWAAENGFDQIAWTPGEVQNKRYNLSAHVKEINVINHVDGGRFLDVRGEQISIVSMRYGVDGIVTESERSDFVGKNISEIIGKELAERILAIPQDQKTLHSNLVDKFQGGDLEIGGKGMIAFYDRMLVNAANKLGKKWGAKVGVGQIKTDDIEGIYDIVDDQGDAVESANTRAMADGVLDRLNRQDPSRNWRIVDATRNPQVWTLPVTDAMRSAAMEGLPLFAARHTKTFKARKSVVEGRLRRIVAQVAGPEIEVQFWDRMTTGPQNAARVRASGGVLGQDIGGSYDPINQIVKISMASDFDQLNTALHESWHSLESLLTPQEQEILTREMRRIRAIAAFDISGGAEAEISGLSDIEATAYAAAAYMEGRLRKGKGLHIAVRKIFDKIAKIIRQTRNMLRGMGFKTAEDIWEGALQGDIAARDSLEARGGTETAFMARGRPRTNRAPPGATFVSPQDNARVRNFIMRNISTRLGSVMWSETFWRRGLQDRMIDARNIQDAIVSSLGRALPESWNVYMQEALYYGRTGARLQDLRYDHIDPLVEAMRGAKITMSELGEFLYARHAPERNALIATRDPGTVDGSGMTNAESAQILADIRASGKWAEFNALAARVDAITQKSRVDMLRGGLISRDQFDALQTKFAHYVPLRGFEADPDSDEDIPSVGRGFDVRGREYQTALGRRSKADNALAYVLLQATQTQIRSEKNRVATTLLRLARANPNTSVWEINKPELKPFLNKTTGLREMRYIPPHMQMDENIHVAKIGGKPVWITIHHPGLARAMKMMGNENLNFVFRQLAKINRTLSALNTAYTPEFVISNAFRDLQTALLHMSEEEVAGLRTAVVKDLPWALSGTYGGLKGKRNTEWQRYFREFSDAGGKISFFNLQDIATQKSRIERAFSKGKVRAGLQAGAEFVENANLSVENAVRLSLYVNLRRAGKSKADAAIAAREITVNFNRKGEWGAMLNASHLFYNAAIQGNVRMFQALKRSKIVRRAVMGMAVFAFGLDWLNYIMAGDDDDGMNRYEKIREWEKERNMIFMWPDGSGRYTKIPLPYGYSVFHVLGQQAAGVVRYEAGTSIGIPPMDAAANIVSAMSGSFMPINPGSTLLQFFSPTIADPLVEMGENKNWFGGPIYPTSFPGDKRPDSQRSFQGTSPIWKSLSQSLNAITGGNEFKSGRVDISPETFEHLFEFVTGGAGRFAGNAGAMMINAVQGEEILPNDVPFARRVHGEVGGYVNSGIYYDMRDKIEAVEHELKGWHKAGNREKMDAVRRSNPAEVRAIGAFKGAEKEMRKLRKAESAIKARKDMPKDQKRARLQRIKDRRDKVQQQARTAYVSALKDQNASSGPE